jgi:hypothetical protein
LNGLTFDFDNSPGDPDCKVTPWNDPTPAPPIDDNPGTTRGQQRRNALLRTGELLTQQLNITVPIAVQACWEAQGGSPSEGATIAHAGPTTFALDTPGFRLPWLPDKYAFYAVTEIVRQAGTRQCGALGGDCNVADIVATFNSDLDPPNNVLNIPFYYGYSGVSKPTRTIDFVSVAMHEITHGLGFLGLVNVDPQDGPIGERPKTSSGKHYDDVFSRRIVTVDAAKNVKAFLGPTTTDAERAAAVVSVSGLRWSDAEANSSSVNVLAALAPPDNFVRLYAPCEAGSDVGNCTTAPGSTLSHTDDNTHVDDLMNAFDNGKPLRTLGLARPMLNVLGWSGSETVLPTYGRAFPNNWYDRNHSGHGIDFQKVFTDPVYGDLYYAIFYSFDTANRPETYSAIGHFVDGKFVAVPADAAGNTLSRILYDKNRPAGSRTYRDPAVPGTIAIDFNQAEYSPACRESPRVGATALAVLTWKIGTEKGEWCLEPSIPDTLRTTPDFGGHWWGGTLESGWGLEITTLRVNNSTLLVAILYYPDAAGVLRWAIGSSNTFTSGGSFDLLEQNGFCRSCPVPTKTTAKIGTITLTLNQPTREDDQNGAAPLSGTNRVDIQIPGVFVRNNVPLTLISAPPGG